MSNSPVRIVGRTGSLFTRLPLIFAEELGVAYELVAVKSLTSLEPAVYAGNPALKMPSLWDTDSVLFGAQNICRALAERSTTPARIVWPEDLSDVLSRNAQELVWHCMAAQVQILMGTYVGNLPAEHVFLAKARAGLNGALEWLDEHGADVLKSLPQQRNLSLFEVALFCLVEHLQFGPTVPVEKYASLLSFAREFGMRPSARRTAFR